MKMQCTCCLKLKDMYVDGWCKECSDKLDKHIEGDELISTNKCQISNEEAKV